MSLLDAAYWVACVVLVVSGAVKLADPSATAETIGAIGPAVPVAAARVLGVVEVLLGGAGLLLGSGAAATVVALLVAALYVGFALVVLAARRRGLGSCGCMGARSGPPSIGHVMVDLVFAAVALAAAVAGPVDLAEGLGTLSTAAAVAVAAAVALASGVVVARM